MKKFKEIEKVIFVPIVVQKSSKLGCVVRMVIDSILPHAESGPNDHRKDAPPFTKVVYLYQLFQNSG